MGLQIHNSLTRRFEPFRPLKGRTVRLYTCGPTVYDFAHVGNLRTYVFEDILKRVLKLNGYRIRHVMNITDVGHLTDDADQGEDKLERAAATQQKSARQLAAFYTRTFLKDIKRLNILKPDEMPRATQYIREQIALVRRLERLGYTYTINDGVYFDTSKFAAYGQAFAKDFSSPYGEGEKPVLRSFSEGGEGVDQRIFSPAHREGELEGVGVSAHSRIAVNPEKRSPHDFALWKLTPPGVKRQMEWNSPWGVGFPGWHLECSVMARTLLGQPFDIHCGGIDHIPIHHTNEIAQSEAAYGKPLAHFWLHGAFLTVEGKRMGKSEGNFITIDELVRRGFDPLAYRYLVLGAHYRSPVNFTWDALAGAQTALEHLREYCRTLPKECRGGIYSLPLAGVRFTPAEASEPAPTWSEGERAVIERLQAAFNDDLDTPKALATLWDAVRSAANGQSKRGITSMEASAIIAYADQVLGLELARFLGKPIRIPKKVQALAAAREEARRQKDWAHADLLRAQISALGFCVEDTKDGPAIRSASRT
ncbi:MAG: cysteine--tRNA ligase [Candidatus Uhrbacteria bacterium]